MSDNEPKRLEYPITENYSPEITIEVIGPTSNKSLVAVVDTGYTGFLQIPLSVGIACNLRLWGIGTGRLADGSKVKNIQCIGEIRFADQKIFNIISLSEGGEDCLLGMQFLQSIDMDFTVSPKDKKAIFMERKKSTTVTTTPTETATVPKQEDGKKEPTEKKVKA